MIDRLRAGLRTIDADARHMRAKYGPEAIGMCDYAIAGATAPEVRMKLKLVKAALWADWFRRGAQGVSPQESGDRT
jgi:hypothetical protein